MHQSAILYIGLQFSVNNPFIGGAVAEFVCLSVCRAVRLWQWMKAVGALSREMELALSGAAARRLQLVGHVFNEPQTLDINYLSTLRPAQ